MPMKMPGPYASSVDVRPAAGPRADTSAFEAPAAAAARGFAGLGELATNIGTKIEHEESRLRALEARTDASNRAASARLDMTTALVDAQNKAPAGAPNFTPNFLENTFGPYAKETLANAPEGTRAYLKQHLGQLRTHFGELALNFEANSNLNKRQSDLNQTIDKFANVVRTDPSQFEGALQDAAVAVDNSGLPADRTEKAHTHVRGMLATSMAEGLIDTDGQAARKVLADPRFDTFFPPNVKNQLIERNEARIAKRDNENAAALRAEVKSQYDNEVAAIRDRGYGVGGLSPAALRQAFPDQADDLLKNLNTERQFYNARQEIALNTPEKDQAVLARFKPEGEDYALQASRRDALQAAIGEKWKQATRDPVGYLTGASPELRRAFDDAAKDPAKLPAALALSDQLQTQIGLPQHGHFILSAGQASDLVGKITSAPPEQAAATIQGLSKTYGDRWPSVFSELVGQKLPEGYQVLAAIDPPAARAHLVEAIKTGKKQLHETLGPDAKAIDDGLHDAVKPLLETMAPAPNGAALGAAWQHATQLLAYRYATLGESSSDALKHAVNDLVSAKYDLVQGGGTNARAPKGFGGTAQRHADTMLAGLKAADIEVPPRGRDELPLTDAQRVDAYFRDGVKNGGRWITNRKDDGWFLIDAARQPVLRKDGTPVGFTFDEARKAAAMAPAPAPNFHSLVPPL